MFRHNDLNHLEDGLKAEAPNRPAGPRDVHRHRIAVQHGRRPGAAARRSWTSRSGTGRTLIVDEAHCTGCFGPRGSGCVDELGLRSRVLATVHTGGKALGVTGAYICGSRLLQGIPRQPVPAPDLHDGAAAGDRRRGGCDMLPTGAADDARPQRAARERRSASAPSSRNAAFRHSGTYIVPVVLGDDTRRCGVATRLQERGYDIRAIRPPIGPAGHGAAAHLDSRRPRARVARSQLAGARRGGDSRMIGFVVVGTDTDAGKTDVLAAVARGVRRSSSTTGSRSRRATPIRYESAGSCRTPRFTNRSRASPSPSRPALAARARRPADARRRGDRSRPVPHPRSLLLIETFGGPLSPLNDDELADRTDPRASACRSCSSTSSAVGAVGRTLAVVRALREASTSLRSCSWAERDELRRGADRRSTRHCRACGVSLRMRRTAGMHGRISRCGAERTAVSLPAQACRRGYEHVGLGSRRHVACTRSRPRRRLASVHVARRSRPTRCPSSAPRTNSCNSPTAARSSTASRRGGRSCTAIAIRR